MKIFAFTCLLFMTAFSSSGPDVSCAFAQNVFHPDHLQTTTGTIVGKGRNTLEILDELDHRVKRYVYLKGSAHLKQGDRVRVYWRSPGMVIELLKKMSP